MSSDLEIVWLAGLLEGEGYFCLDRHQRGGGRHRPSVEVGIEMSDEDVVRRAALTMNSNVRYRKPRKLNHKPTWVATARGQKAVDVMTLVHEHMGERRSARIAELLSMENLSHHPKATV